MKVRFMITRLTTTMAVLLYSTLAQAQTWTIDAPAVNATFGNSSDVSGYGSGPASSNMTIGVYKWDDGTWVAINTKSSGTSPEGNWSDEVAPPSTGFWWDTMDFGTHDVYFQIHAGSPAEKKASTKIRIQVEGPA